MTALINTTANTFTGAAILSLHRRRSPGFRDLVWRIARGAEAGRSYAADALQRLPDSHCDQHRGYFRDYSGGRWADHRGGSLPRRVLHPLGAIILVSSIASTRFRRIREVVVLKTLGAKRKYIVAVFSVEFMVLGLLAGVVGVIFANLLAPFCSIGSMWSFRWMGGGPARRLRHGVAGHLYRLVGQLPHLGPETARSVA